MSRSFHSRARRRRLAARHWLAAAAALMLSAGGEPVIAARAAAPPADRGAVGDNQADVVVPPRLDDLDAMPDIGIDWPDLSTMPGPEIPGAVEHPGPAGNAELPARPGDRPEPARLADDGTEHRYTVRFEGIDAIADAAFRDRFEGGALLVARGGRPANIAQINRRMREDAQLLDRLLRAKGYYAARIGPSVAPEQGDGARLLVRFDVTPGPRYLLSGVDLPGLEQAGSRREELARAFPVAAGDPIDADAIQSARAGLEGALVEGGFPFAKVDEPVVEIDHDARSGDLAVPVAPGGYRLFRAIRLEQGATRIFTARHLGEIARFSPESPYRHALAEDLRRAIVATGLVSRVDVSPVDSGDGRHVDVLVNVSPAPMRTVAGEAGFGTGEGYRLSASWQHRNLFPPEGALAVRGVLGTKEQSFGLVYRRNNFHARDRVLNASLSFARVDQAAYAADTADLGISLERQTNLIFQKNWTWTLGADLLASRERDLFGAQAARTYLIAALPLGLSYDDSDDLLDPRRGFRLGARLSPELAFQSGASGYVRSQIDASAYLPVGERVVLASRARLGSILGVGLGRIAPSRRYYAGGGGSVRGYAYQAIGPRNANNAPAGGLSLMEFSLETRVRFGNLGVVPFVDAGAISTGAVPQLTDMRYGAGVGLRYYSSFGPIRIDVGTPLNPRTGDARIAVYVSLGQAF